MSIKDKSSLAEAAPSCEDEASELFVQRLYGEWTARDQAAFEARLEKDSVFADAYRRVEESWQTLDEHAETPELMVYREEAISSVRRINKHRWLKPGVNRWRMAAATAGLALAGALVWQLSPYGYRPGEYRTAIGEQRIIELDDHSRIALDAASRLQVRYSNDARVVQLVQGQAQFSVAKDPTRPFKVQAGDRTIVALGTVFTVEYVDKEVSVAMLEGRVAVVPDSSAASEKSLRAMSAPQPAPVRIGEVASVATEVATKVNGAEIIELAAGEALRVERDGRAMFTSKADLEAATAWREGKVILRTEPLSEAVRRMNRYSHLQIKIGDAALAARHISGVFEAGDTQGFVGALQRYMPVQADYVDSDTVRLSVR